MWGLVILPSRWKTGPMAPRRAWDPAGRSPAFSWQQLGLRKGSELHAGREQEVGERAKAGPWQAEQLEAAVRSLTHLHPDCTEHGGIFLNSERSFSFWPAHAHRSSAHLEFRAPL